MFQDSNENKQSNSDLEMHPSKKSSHKSSLQEPSKDLNEDDHGGERELS
jgi:hypothetical protein